MKWSAFQAPYWLVEFKSEEDVKQLSRRSVSLRCCTELWGCAKNMEELHDKLKPSLSGLPKSYFDCNKTFKIEVETFCKHLTQKEKVTKLEVCMRVMNIMYFVY